MPAPGHAMLVLYTRLDPSEMLAHETRRGILARVTQAPGATLVEVAQAVHVHYKTALYHARMLARGGQLVVTKRGGRTECYPVGASSHVAPPRLAAAFDAVKGGAGTPATLARALGVPRGTAGSLLGRLAARGLLTRQGGVWVPSEHPYDKADMAPAWPASRSGS